MDTKTRAPTPKSAEAFWRSAYVAAELPTLLKFAGGEAAPEGLAHLAAEYADASLREYRTRFSK